MNYDIFNITEEFSELKNVKVIQMTEFECNKYPDTLGFIDANENPPIIRLLPGMDENTAEFVLYHEIYHLKQNQARKSGNKKYIKAFENYSDLSEKLERLEYLEQKYKNSKNKNLIDSIKNDILTIQYQMYNNILEKNADNYALKKYKQRRNYNEK